MIDKAKRKEQELKDKIAGIKEEIVELDKQLERNVAEIKLSNEKNVAELTRNKNDLMMSIKTILI